MGVVRTRYLAPTNTHLHTALDIDISRYEYVYWSAHVHVWICICIPWRGQTLHITAYDTMSRSEVCQHFEVPMKGGMKKKCDTKNGQTSSESLQSLVAHIGHIALNSFNFNQGVQLAATQSLSASTI